MLKTNKRKLILYLARWNLLLLVLVAFPRIVLAAENVNLENQNTGTGSTNSLNVEVSDQSNVEMVNSGVTVNEINLTVNSGQNQADANNGESQVDTGDVGLEVQVETQGNVNDAEFSEDAQETNINLTNQSTGTDSDNQIDVVLNDSNTVEMNNSSDVTNNIDLNLNSGENKTNGNNGDVKVHTGDISVSETIKNHVGANRLVGEMCGLCGATTVNQSNVKTGEDSINKIEVVVNKNSSVHTDNKVVLKNEVKGDINTGQNEANENNGETFVESGEIVVNVEVDNELNDNDVDIAYTPENDPSVDPGDADPGSAEDNDPDDPSAPVVPVTNNGGSSSDNTGNNNSSGSSGSGSVANASVSAVGGAVLGAILPETGNPYWLAMWMMGLFLISMGRYVRLNSGRSPAV